MKQPTAKRLLSENVLLVYPKFLLSWRRTYFRTRYNTTQGHACAMSLFGVDFAICSICQAEAF